MDIHLPDHIASELERVAPSRRRTRLRVQAGDVLLDIVEMDGTGFSLHRDSDSLRGSVAIFNGSRHIADCLIVAAERDGPVMRYEYKRWTDVHDTAALDYVREETAPLALLS